MQANLTPQKSIFGSGHWIQTTLLVLVFLIGFGIRLVNLKSAPLDFHAPRQLRSALIARGLYYRMLPNADPILRQQAMNLGTLEVYEPPIFEGLVALTYKIARHEILWVSRIFSDVFWMIGGLALLQLGRRFARWDATLISLGFYFFLPFSVTASRSFQPDPWMVMWILLFAWGLVRWCEKLTWKRAVIAGLLGGMAVLVKAFAGFFILAIVASVLVEEWKTIRPLRNPKVYLIGLLIALPPLIYYVFILGGRSASFLSFWTGLMIQMVLTTKFYAQWLAMIKGLMGLTVVIAALLGVTLAKPRLRAVLLGGWLGYGLFALSSPFQFVTHEYYHLALVPIVALSLVPLLDVLCAAMADLSWLWRLAAVGVLLFAAGYSLYVERSILASQNYQSEVISWERVGAAVPQNHSFIAFTADYGVRLRYFGWRVASAFWPSSSDLNLADLRGNAKMDVSAYFKDATNGMDYFLVTALGELDKQPELKEILQGYPVYYKGNGFTIYDLRMQ